MELRVDRHDDLISINSNGRSLGFSVEGALELHRALGLVLHEYPLYTFYENEAHAESERTRREWVSRIEERERASRAGYRIPSRTQPKGKLEDI